MAGNYWITKFLLFYLEDLNILKYNLFFFVLKKTKKLFRNNNENILFNF